MVGESGSGKSVTALSTVDLLPDQRPDRLARPVCWAGDGRRGRTLLRKVRGNDIAFIFQEPMTSLNPLHTLEKQLDESLALHQGLSGTRRAGGSLELLTQVGINDPAAGWVPIRTSCRAGSASG